MNAPAGVARKRRFVGRHVSLFFAGLCLTLPGALRSGSADPSPQEAPTVTMAFTASVFSWVNRDDAQIAMQLWTAELASILQEKYRGIAVIYDDAEEALQSVVDGKTDLITLPTIDYLTHGEGLGLEPVLVGVYSDGSITERYVLVVRDDSGAAGLVDLGGQDLLLGATSVPRICQLWLDVLLMRGGLPTSQSHLRLQYVDRASQAVLPVLFGQHEAAVVTERAFQTMVELNPQIGAEMRVVARSPEVVAGLTWISPSCAGEVRELVLAASQTMHEKVAGRQILSLFGMKRVDLFRPQNLHSIRALFDEHRALSRERQPVAAGG